MIRTPLYMYERIAYKRFQNKMDNPSTTAKQQQQQQQQL
jgi:hypothetical protein